MASPTGLNLTQSRHRKKLSIGLVVLGCLAVPFAVTGLWVKTVLLSTDGYVAAVSSLIGRPAVQQVVAGELSDQIIAQMDLQGRAGQLLPDGTGQLLQPMIEQIEYYTRQICAEFVASEVFRPIWTEANREAHRAFVGLVEGNRPLELTSKGVIVLNLDKAAAELNRRLHEASIPLPPSLLPDLVSGEVAVIDVGPFLKLRALLYWLNKLAIFLPVLAAALLAGGILLARRRLRSLVLAGGGVVLVMIVFEVARAVGSSAYHRGAARVGVPPEISNALWDPLVSGLDLASRLILLLAVGLVLVVLLISLWRRPPTSGWGFWRG